MGISSENLLQIVSEINAIENNNLKEMHQISIDLSNHCLIEASNSIDASGSEYLSKVRLVNL